MSDKIDISVPSKRAGKAKKSPKPKGATSRFVFTLAIATAICLSIITFLWILGRTTQDSGPPLNVEQRSKTQTYQDALAIPEKPLRLRALRNYISAYPSSKVEQEALELIDTLEVDEHEKWLALSDVFYTATASTSKKIDAIEVFEGEWGSGTYVQELARMKTQIDAPPPAAVQKRAELESLNDVSEQQMHSPQDVASGTYMAGAAPIEIYKPAVLFPAAAPKPVVVSASIRDDVEPSYPSRARSRSIEAVVTVAMDIDEDGDVQDAYIVKPATGRYANDFGRAAIRAAKKTKFKPKTIDGVAAPMNGFTRRYRFEMGE